MGHVVGLIVGVVPLSPFTKLNQKRGPLPNVACMNSHQKLLQSGQHWRMRSSVRVVACERGHCMCLIDRPFHLSGHFSYFHLLASATSVTVTWACRLCLTFGVGSPGCLPRRVTAAALLISLFIRVFLSFSFSVQFTINRYKNSVSPHLVSTCYYHE